MQGFGQIQATIMHKEVLDVSETWMVLSLGRQPGICERKGPSIEPQDFHPKHRFINGCGGKRATKMTVRAILHLQQPSFDLPPALQ